MWGTLFFWISIALYIYFSCGAIYVVILENRQPVKTMAWVLVLIALPIVGLILFDTFGRNIRKEKLISRKSVDLLTRKALTEYFTQPPAQRPKAYEPIIRFFEQLEGAMPYGGNDLDFYSEGSDFICALLHEIAQAKHHIHLEVYIFEDDAVGRLVRDALIDAAQRGVNVRLIYDDVGCWSVKQRFFDEMAEKGIMTLNFMPVRFPRLTHKINYRNHRKVCVVDGRVGFIGGMNIARRYVRGLGGGPWRDRHLKIIGGGVYDLQRTFLLDWFFMSRELINDARYYPSITPKPTPEAVVQIVSSSPVSRWPEIMYGFVWALQNAKRYIYIQSPYFMPTEPIIGAMQTAAMSGVDVRLMVPQHPDSFWMGLANRSYFEEVLKAGVKLYTFSPGFLHSKMIVSDDAFSTVGSANMDFRSFENNFEVNAFIYDRGVAHQLRRLFEKDLRSCKRVDESKWESRGQLKKFKESCVRIISPLM